MLLKPKESFSPSRTADKSTPITGFIKPNTATFEIGLYFNSRPHKEYATAEIAAMLGEPEDYIKAQIKEYENSGVIKGYQAVVNWDMVDDSYVEALIELQVTPKKETGFDEMAELCMGFEEVESLYLMAGTYDFALIVRGESMQDIAMFVAKKLSTIDGVLSTGTHFIMRRYKDRGACLFSDEEKRDGRHLIL